MASWQKLNYCLIAYISLRFFRSNIFYFTKLCIGSIFTTIGVLWNETLHSVDILKDFAYFIKDILDSNLNIKIPDLYSNSSKVDIINTSPSNTEVLTKNQLILI